MNKVQNATLIYPLKDGQILLGLKQRKVSAGKFAGYGGKFDLEIDSSIDDTCIRELYEETGKGIICNKVDLCPQAIINFTLNVSTGIFFKMKVFIYTVSKFTGKYFDNSEMIQHKWFKPDKNMYHLMLPDNQLFLPKILNGDFFIGEIISKEGKVVKHYFKEIEKEELYRIFQKN